MIQLDVLVEHVTACWIILRPLVRWRHHYKQVKLFQGRISTSQIHQRAYLIWLFRGNEGSDLDRLDTWEGFCGLSFHSTSLRIHVVLWGIVLFPVATSYIVCSMWEELHPDFPSPKHFPQFYLQWIPHFWTDWTLYETNIEAFFSPNRRNSYACWTRSECCASSSGFKAVWVSK